MEKQNIKIFQERDFGELISVSINFFIQEIKPIIKNLLYFVGPFVLITTILSSIYNVGLTNDISQIFKIFKGDLSQVQQTNPDIVGTFFIGFVGIIQNIVLYSVIGVYVKLYTERGRGNFETQDVFNGVKNIFLPVLGGQLLAGIMIIAGFVLLIIPGVYIAIAMSILFAIIIFEEIGVGESISKSFQLIKGNWWLTLGSIFVLGILTSIISAIFAGVIGLIFVGGVNSMITAIYSIIIGFGSVIVSSVVILLPVFLYASYVTQKENPTLINRISNISEKENENGIMEEAKTDENSSSEDVWEKLIDKNKTEDKKDENRFTKDDDNDRFKPKF